MTPVDILCKDYKMIYNPFIFWYNLFIISEVRAMSKLTQEKIDVLDKLYNIKGEKSVVTTAIQAKIEKKEADIDTTTTEKNHIIEQQVELEKELQQFIEQTDKFLATFSAFDNTSFSSFQSIGIDLALGDALATLRQKAPGHEDNLEDRIKSLKEQVEELSEKK